MEWKFTQTRGKFYTNLKNRPQSGMNWLFKLMRVDYECNLSFNWKR